MSGLRPYHKDRFDERVDRRAEQSAYDEYTIHAGMTCTLATEVAETPLEAMGQWAEAHNVQGRLLCSFPREEPMEHQVAIVQRGGQKHRVTLIKSSVLRGDAHA